MLHDCQTKICLTNLKGLLTSKIGITRSEGAAKHCLKDEFRFAKRFLLTSCLPTGRFSAIVKKSVAEGNARLIPHFQ